jgi:drug/metabolite transporter (DMT)-like permease
VDSRSSARVHDARVHDARAYGALVGAMAIWGLSFLATKELLPTVPVLSLLFARFAIAAALLAAFGLAQGGRGRALRVSRRDLAMLAGLSILSPVGYYLFETYGVAWTQAGHVSVLIATIPIGVYLIAFARRMERVTRRRTLGILLAFGGVILLMDSSSGEAGASLAGDLLVLGAVLCAAVQTILLKDAVRRVTPLQLTFYQALLSLVVFGPLASIDGFAWVGQLSPAGWVQLLFLAIFCSGVAFLAMNYALVRLPVTSVAVSVNLVPVITLLAEALLLGVRLAPAKLGGAALILLGVLATQLDGQPATVPPSGAAG